MSEDEQGRTSPLDLGALTDELSRDLAEALAIASDWDIRRVELREGAKGRFPAFTKDEINLVEDAVRQGLNVTAVSPGIFKGSVEDRATVDRELDRVFPESLDLAGRFGCSTIIIFGFEKMAGESDGNRTSAMKAFEAAARRAEDRGITVAVENEPNFWADLPQDVARMLEEIGHPLLGTNWDPANAVWGGHEISREDFDALRPHIRNVHVKDFDPADTDEPWRPVGHGVMDWEMLLTWIAEDTKLEHVTLETHCLPLFENSRESMRTLRSLVTEAA